MLFKNKIKLEKKNLCKSTITIKKHLFLLQKKNIKKYYLSYSRNYMYPEREAEKAMAPHSSTLAWKIPWMEEPGGLQPMGSLGVGHN